MRYVQTGSRVRVKGSNMCVNGQVCYKDGVGQNVGESNVGESSDYI